jgi:hypothetical protein
MSNSNKNMVLVLMGLDTKTDWPADRWSQHNFHFHYHCKGSVAKKNIAGRDPQGAWRQDELIGGKPPVVK